jgi:hypothetical protein
VNNLTAMQCMWYALECGASHVRQRQYGRALKRYHEVAKVRVAVGTHPALARACLCLCGLAHQTHLFPYTGASIALLVLVRRSTFPT